MTSINQEAADIIRPLIERRLGAQKVTFVALKDANQQILKSVVPDVIDWSDLSQTEPADWENAFWKAYGCSKSLTILKKM